ncbi:MAG: hypothetical protein ACFCAD_02070 [Pleurocapsa sp.]
MGNIQAATTPTTDTIFSWQSTHRHIECQCRLRIYYLASDRYLVIISALDDYPSANDERSLQQLIYQISYCYDLSLQKTMWIEHYSPSNQEDTDFYYHLLTAWHQVSWYSIGQQQLITILDQNI